MKKVAIAILGAAVVATSAYAQQVLSRNAVGYVKVEIDKGDFAMIQNPFLPLQSASLTVTNLIGDQVPAGTAVFIWDGASQQYISETKFPFGWLPGTNSLDPGRGFFLSVPASAVSNTYTVFMMGEVPDQFTQPTATINIAAGFNMVGFPYPVQNELTNTTLAASLPAGSVAFVWNQASQSYSSETKFPFGWLPGTLVLQPGQAVFVQTVSSDTWVETKPYTWP